MTAFVGMIAAVAIVALPSPIPPDTSRLPLDLFVTSHGCVASRIYPSRPTPPAYYKNPNSGYADSDDMQRAYYAEWKGMHGTAATLFKRALKETTMTGISVESLCC